MIAKWIYNRLGQTAALDCGDTVYDQNGNFRLWNSKINKTNGYYSN